jgi:NADPH:quinone reductase-like Zn-dependent oxidoreductase
MGCDYSGLVDYVGKSVRKEFAKGDRICGFAHGANAIQSEDGGTFADFIVEHCGQG